MAKIFSLQVETINGDFQEFPQRIEVDCQRLIPIGPQVIRDFDSIVENIVAKRVFLMQYGRDVYGTTQFFSFNDFWTFVSGACQPCACNECPAMMNGCYVLINGCRVDMCNGCKTHIVTMNNCFVLLNGCKALLN